MLKHTGTLFLSRAQRPQATQARDGTFCLTLLAIDRNANLPQPYLLIWTGPHARAFWRMHADEMTEGAELQVELTNLILHSFVPRGGHTTVTQLVADVNNLQVLTKASNRSQFFNQKQPPALVHAGLSAIN